MGREGTERLGCIRAMAVGQKGIGRWMEETRKELTRRRAKLRIVPDGCRARTMGNIVGHAGTTTYKGADGWIVTTDIPTDTNSAISTLHSISTVQLCALSAAAPRTSHSF